MAVRIAEYLGQRTDVASPDIKPIPPKSNAQCPFMDRACDKVSKGNHPVCSVRKPSGVIWIVCEHRLCSTRRKEKRDNKDVDLALVPHQIDILYQVAKTVYGPNIQQQNIGIRREVNIPLEAGNSYHADYVMRNFTPGSKIDEILLEMQGGGETSSTGAISRHITDWALNAHNTNNTFLYKLVAANTIETNAWRRQQEQFLVKGNVVSQTGGKIVFAVGRELYEYLSKRFQNANLRDLRKHNWTLCMLAFDEDTTNPPSPGPIPLVVDQSRLLFTNYSTFVRFLTDQGGPCPELFEGEFLLLDGNTHTVV